MDDTYIIKKEYGAGSQYRTRNPKVMSFVSYQTAPLCDILAGVERVELSSFGSKPKVLPLNYTPLYLLPILI